MIKNSNDIQEIICKFYEKEKMMNKFEKIEISLFDGKSYDWECVNMWKGKQNELNLKQSNKMKQLNRNRRLSDTVSLSPVPVTPHPLGLRYPPPPPRPTTTRIARLSSNSSSSSSSSSSAANVHSHWVYNENLLC